MMLCLCFYLYYIFTTISGQDLSRQRKIGAIFDENSRHLAETFRLEVGRLSTTDKDIELVGTVEIVDCLDSFYVSNAICHLLEQNVYGILGAFQSCALSTIQSYTDTFKVPFVSLSMPQPTTSLEPYQLYIRPSYIEGLLDVVAQKEWNKIYYIYESDEGLVRLQQLFQEINKREMDLDIAVKRIVSLEHCHQMLRGAYNTEIKQDLRLLLDLTTKQSEELITAIKKDPDISNNRFHFLLVDLGINDMNSTVLTPGLNVSGFSLKVPEKNHWDVQLDRKRTFGDLLVHDAVNVFHRALKKVEPMNSISHHETIKCRDNEGTIQFRPGKRVLSKVQDVHYKGLSGEIKFDDNGWRKDFRLPLYETRMNMQVAKVGVYAPGAEGFRTHEPVKGPGLSLNGSSVGRVHRITTVKVIVQKF